MARALMIIPNHLIKLDYDPAWDVLSVEWPDFHYYSVSEAAYTLDIIVETVRLYDVKRLLIDNRKSTVDIPESEYREVVLRFAKDLALTRLRKIARVVPDSALGERLIRGIRQEAHLDVEAENFAAVGEALGWLTYGNRS